MNQPLNRRAFIVTLAASGAAFATGAKAQVTLDEKDPQAAALGYVTDAARANGKKYPRFAAGQHCGNCALYQGKSGDKSGPCPVYGGKLVATGGWCSSWAKKA